MSDRAVNVSIANLAKEEFTKRNIEVSGVFSTLNGRTLDFTVFYRDDNEVVKRYQMLCGVNTDNEQKIANVIVDLFVYAVIERGKHV